MTPAPQDDVFFIGWSGKTGRRLGRFLVLAGVVFVAGLALLGFGLSRNADDPAGSLLRLGEHDATGRPVGPEAWGGEVVMRGHVSLAGSPLLHLPADAAHPRGRVLLLAGDGKHGAALPDGAGPVELRGSILKRGSIEMLVVDGPVKALGADAALPPANREALGRWRIAGEICDGKCYSGAMRPGSGLAHKACANLCLIGQIPAVLVTAAPVAGSSYLVLAAADGGPVPDAIREIAAIPVSLEGEVERIGNVLVLRVDIKSLRRL